MKTETAPQDTRPRFKYLTDIEEIRPDHYRARIWIENFRSEWSDSETRQQAREWLDGMVKYYRDQGII